MLVHASLFAACKYEHSDRPSWYTQFDVHDGGSILPLPTSLVEEASNVTLVRLITLCGFDPVQSFLVLRWMSEID